MITHFRFAISFESSTAFVLKEKMPCNTHGSNSAVLSLAAFLVEHFPHMLCPTRHDMVGMISIPFSGSDIHELIEDHPNYGIWCIYINNCVYSKHAANVHNTLYIQIPLGQESLKHFLPAQQALFQEKHLPEGKHSNEDRLKMLFGISSIMKNKSKIGVFANTPKDIFKFKYIDSAHLLGQMYNNEDWHYFQITNDQTHHIPTVDQLMTFDCIILPGSPLSVLDQHPKISLAMSRLFTAYAQSQTLKVMGICFGHQLISKHFKAKVQKRHKCLNIEKIEFHPQVISQYNFLKPIVKGGLHNLYVSQNHEDHVTQVPQGFHLLGKSESCGIESLVSHNGRILTMQFHPEFFSNNQLKRRQKESIEMRKLIDPLLFNQLKNNNEHNKQKSSLRNLHYRDAQIMRKCMILFMQQ